MDVLQGRYLKKIESKRGQLKGFELETADGTQSIYLSKSIREIAQQELQVGDLLRVWLAIASKHHKKKQGKKKQGKKAQTEKRYAVAVIPLSPKTMLKGAQASVAEAGAEGTKPKPSKAKPSKAKQSKKAKSKKAKSRPLTVQLCQKKNCCKKGGTALWERFERERFERAQVKLKHQETAFKLEAVGCLGGCKRGPNIRFLPKNVKHYHVQPDDITRLLDKYSF